MMFSPDPDPTFCISNRILSESEVSEYFRLTQYPAARLLAEFDPPSDIIVYDVYF